MLGPSSSDLDCSGVNPENHDASQSLLVAFKQHLSTATPTSHPDYCACAQYLNQSTGQLQQLGSVPSPRYANATCYNLLQSLNLTFVYSVLDAGSSGVAATMQIIAVRFPSSVCRASRDRVCDLDGTFTSSAQSCCYHSDHCGEVPEQCLQGIA